MLNKIGGRKMAVGFLTLGVGVAFAAVKGDVSPGLLQLLSVIFGAYVVGNGFEHMAKRGQPAQPSATVDLSAVTSKVDTLQATITQMGQTSGLAVAEIKALAEQAAAGSAASADALSMIIRLYKIDEVYAKQQSNGDASAKSNSGV